MWATYSRGGGTPAAPWPATTLTGRNTVASGQVQTGWGSLSEIVVVTSLVARAILATADALNSGTHAEEASTATCAGPPVSGITATTDPVVGSIRSNVPASPGGWPGLTAVVSTHAEPAPVA